jgi:hypothetical protein
MLLIQLHRVQRGRRVTGGVKHFPQDGRKAIVREEVRAEMSVSSAGRGGCCNTSGVTMARAHLGTKDCDHVW